MKIFQPIFSGVHELETPVSVATSALYSRIFPTEEQKKEGIKTNKLCFSFENKNSYLTRIFKKDLGEIL